MIVFYLHQYFAHTSIDGDGMIFVEREHTEKRRRGKSGLRINFITRIYTYAIADES